MAENEVKVVSGEIVSAEEEPTFDVSRLSWRDTKLGYRAQIMINKAHTEGDADLMDDSLAGLESLLARTVLTVPRSWLVDDAPEEINWRDPKSLDWLQGNKFSDLLTAMNNATTPQGAAKN